MQEKSREKRNCSFRNYFTPYTYILYVYVSQDTSKASLIRTLIRTLKTQNPFTL
jgi:hypothetical protein